MGSQLWVGGGEEERGGREGGREMVSYPLKCVLPLCMQPAATFAEGVSGKGSCSQLRHLRTLSCIRVMSGFVSRVN